MTQQFHEGQDVEVRKIADGMNEMHWSWHKAKVVNDDLWAYPMNEAELINLAWFLWEYDFLKGCWS